MTICLVCGGEHFNEIDGEYFCSVCETQCHDLRLIEAEDEFVNEFTFTPQVPTGPKEKRPVKRADQGHPWSCDEAFLLILKQQCRSLRLRGAPPKIDDLVFKLLSTFLSRIQSAYTDEAGLNTSIRERDKCIGNTEMPRIKNVSRVKSAIGELEAYFENPEESIPENILELDDEEESAEGVMSMQTLRKRPLYFRLITTLAICEIALMYSVDSITPSDIIKWTRDGTLPYSSVIDELPEFMDLTAKDLWTFRPLKTLSSRDIRSLTGKVLYHLGVSVLPTMDVEKLICRYVAEMELPTAINGMACCLYRFSKARIDNELTVRARALPTYEGIALSYILLILSMVFGCDDVTEKNLDRMADANGCDGRYFRWGEWTRHLENKLAKKRASRLPTNYDGIKSCRYEFETTCPPSTNIRYCRTYNPKLYRSETRSALQTPLRTLLIRTEQRKDPDPVPSSDAAETKSYRHNLIYHLQNETSDESLDESGQYYTVKWRNEGELGSEAFSWLLRTCSEVTGCDTKDIELYLERLELTLLLGHSSAALNELATRRRKAYIRTKCFQ